MTAFVMSGVPASGKSTYSKHLSSKYNALVFSYDELKQNAKYFRDLEQVRCRMIEDVINALKHGHNVVIDDLNVSRSMRISLLEQLSSVSCEKVCVVMDTPIEECLKRDSLRTHRLPEYIIQDIYNKYEMPDINEGWEEIIYVKEDNYEIDFTSNQISH